MAGFFCDQGACPVDQRCNQTLYAQNGSTTATRDWPRSYAGISGPAQFAAEGLECSRRLCRALREVTIV